MDEITTTPETEESTGRGRRWPRRSTRNAPPPQGGGAVYGLGMIGALVYFASSAETPKEYVLAVGMAMVWPAILVYRAFRFLGE
jgi:hypothetical protein